VAELSLAIQPSPNPLGGGSLLVNAVHQALLTDCGCCPDDTVCCCDGRTPNSFTVSASARVSTVNDFGGGRIIATYPAVGGTQGFISVHIADGGVSVSATGTARQNPDAACNWQAEVDGNPSGVGYINGNGDPITPTNGKFSISAGCKGPPEVSWHGELTGLYQANPPGLVVTVSVPIFRRSDAPGTDVNKNDASSAQTYNSRFHTGDPDVCFNQTHGFADVFCVVEGIATITPSADGIDCPDTSCATCPLVLSLTITLGDISLCFKVPKDLFFDCVWFRAGTGQGSTGDGWTIRLDKELDDTGDPIWVLDVDSSLNAPLGHFTAHAAATGDPACPQDASSWTIDGNTFADTPTITVHRHDDDPDTGDTGQPCDCPVDCSHCCEVYAIEFSGTCSAPGTPVTRNFTRTSSCSWQSDTGDTLHCTGKKWIITASLGAGTYHFEADIDGPCPPQNSFAMVGDCAAGANPSVIGIGCASATPQPCPSDCTICPDTLALTIVGGSNAGTYPIHRSPSLSCNYAADASGGDPIDIQLSCHAAGSDPGGTTPTQDQWQISIGTIPTDGLVHTQAHATSTTSGCPTGLSWTIDSDDSGATSISVT
jgi:hypothetical protein